MAGEGKKFLAGFAKGVKDNPPTTPGRVATERPEPSQQKQMPVDSYRKGGKVRKTGKARLHKGEVVVGRKSKRGRKGGRE